MKGKLIFKLGALSTILSFLLVFPALGQLNEELGKKLCAFKAQTLKDLKIAADKEKTLEAVEEKCVTTPGKTHRRIEEIQGGFAGRVGRSQP